MPWTEISVVGIVSFRKLGLSPAVFCWPRTDVTGAKLYALSLPVTGVVMSVFH